MFICRGNGDGGEAAQARAAPMDGEPKPAIWKEWDRLVGGSGGSGAAQPGIVWANLVVCAGCVVAASGPGWSESRRSH